MLIESYGIEIDELHSQDFLFPHLIIHDALIQISCSSWIAPPPQCEMAGLLASIETLQSSAETVEPPRRLGVTGQDNGGSQFLGHCACCNINGLQVFS